MSSTSDNANIHEIGEKYPLLASIEGPDDVKRIDLKDLGRLAEELREAIIEVAAKNGGHLASPLGAIEITVALHHVFDLNSDALIWDVGHQAHAHKFLTGRAKSMYTMRRKGGLSGYPRRSESPHDVFGTGHSSTSISAALGLAVARDFEKKKHQIISIIGDGAMTGGMAYEALCHVGHLKKNMLVVLNDNKMSISKNVGGLATSLSRLITGGLYNRAKGDVKTFMEHTVGSHITEAARRFEHSLKGLFIPGAFFEEMGFRYFGPIDGNDLSTLIDVFSNIKGMDGPLLLHCVTQKGKGYPYAEEDPLKYHGVGPYDISTGRFQGSAKASARTFTEGFVGALIEAAEKDGRIIAITAGMPTGTGLDKFEERFPDRFFDVGICEQHAVTFAAGLATQGLRPVAAIYSTFLQRGYDQFIHDVCLQDLPVVFAIDRAGLVGEDSPTQQGAYDLSYLRAVPNITVIAPRDNIDLRLALHQALRHNGPTAVRYGRCKGPAIGEESGRDITRGEILREGEDAYFLAIGPVAGACLEAAKVLEKDGLSVGVADARYVKPLDTQLLAHIGTVPLITVEENSLEGGFGSAVLEYFERQGRLDSARVHRIGIPDRFMDHATRGEQLYDLGLDPASLAEAARAFVGRPTPQTVK